MKKKHFIAGIALTLACVVDSFLIDPLLLFIIGSFIAFFAASYARDNFMRRKILFWSSAATMVIFWGVSISLYFDLSWVSWMWELCGAATGRDWMLNSGIFHFNFSNPPIATHIIAGLLCATYPLWLLLGIKFGTILCGAKKGQTGVIGLFR